MTDYWRSNSELRHLTPPGTEWPEGMYFPTYLSQMFSGQVVTELGCGAGRLSVCFEPSMYTGYDINPHAVRMATYTHPLHNFFVWDERESLLGDCLLAHTVFLHVDDASLDDMLHNLIFRRIVVSEIMNPDLRMPTQKDPPVYNRSLEDYKAIMWSHQYELENRVCVPYEHYMGQVLTIASFERV